MKGGNWIGGSRVRKLGWRLTARLPCGSSWIRKEERANKKWCNIGRIWSSLQSFAGLHWGKCTEKVVERMLKIDMDVIKCGNGNASVGPMRSQISRISETIKNFQIFEIFFEKTIRGWEGKRDGMVEALYESSVRKLGWWFTARLPWSYGLSPGKARRVILARR